MQMVSDENVQSLLKRTALKAPFSEFLIHMTQNYPQLGELLSFTPIIEGYEAANFRLQTSTGDYVLKIFESDRNPENIGNLIQILTEAPKVGVPVPQLVSGQNENLTIFSEETNKIPYYITKLFDGQNFENRLPNMPDIEQITKYLAQLNTLSFPVTEAYDSWGNKNLVQEYQKNKHLLPQNIQEKILPVVHELQRIPLASFSKSVIHGDMQRKHVLKNMQGKYCILDFGCMSFDAKVIDLSTHLAWFCFSEENWHQHQNIFNKVLNIYRQTHHLSHAEIESLPALVRAAYASYFMRTFLLIAEGDVSQETRDWHASAENMLLLSTKF